MTLHTGTMVGDRQLSLRAPLPSAIRRSTHAGDVADSVTHWLAAAEQQDDVYYFSIYVGAELVGQILLHDRDDRTGSSLIAYHLFDQRDRSRGIGTAALKLLLEYVEQETKLTQLYIITSRDNVASQRIAQKCGFVDAGAPHEDPVNGVVFAWLRPEELGT